jgi:hypothetical protein
MSALHADVRLINVCTAIYLRVRVVRVVLLPLLIEIVGVPVAPRLGGEVTVCA